MSLIYYITLTATDKAWERHAIKPALTVLLSPGNVILWKLNCVSTRQDQLLFVLAGKEDTAADTHRLESCRLFLGVYFGLWRWWCGVSGLQTVSCTAAGKCDHLISVTFQTGASAGQKMKSCTMSHDYGVYLCQNDGSWLMSIQLWTILQLWQALVAILLYVDCLPDKTCVRQFNLNLYFWIWLFFEVIIFV